jgi:hypothetical protein
MMHGIMNLKIELSVQARLLASLLLGGTSPARILWAVQQVWDLDAVGKSKIFCFLWDLNNLSS